MSTSTDPLKLPNSIKTAAAVAEKVGVLRTTAEFLRERSGDAKPEDLLRDGRAAPQVAPVAGDERP